MAKIAKAIACVAGFAAVLFVGAYMADYISTGTVLRFSSNTSTPADSTDEKKIYINEDIDRLSLDAKLKLDGGSVSLKVLALTSNEPIWSGTYNEDTNFQIELTGLQAGSKYIIRTQATQAKSMKLTITSQEKLVKNAAKPSKKN